MQKVWNIKDQNPKLQAELSDALKVHPVVAQLLINRGITTADTARQFLSADISDMHDPFLFKGMRKAVDRIRVAGEKKEKVLIFGDYDVDGVTSLALLHHALVEEGLDVVHHIPHRMHDGYGLNHEIGETAQNEGVSLLIAVDCGITAFEEVDSLNGLGIDVIVIDHHEPSEKGVPQAHAIINPKQKDCSYPFSELASVGLVAKLIQALSDGEIDEEVLDLAAMGTIADVVPLVGENRIIVKAGLPHVHKTKNKGLLALMDVAKIKGKKVSPYYVGFILGPRINAAGRMDSAHKSLDLLLCEDDQKAHHLAQVLDKHNSIRQQMQREMVQEALEVVEQEVNFKDQKVIIVAKEGWHKGILGIVASKISDKYYRPAIVISLKEGVGTASARSIEGFHLYNALSQCHKYLDNFGGHEGAAGLTIKEENIDPFRGLINNIANEILEIKSLVPSISIDCEIPLDSISMEMADLINTLEPFGEGNPEPVFCSRGLKVKGIPQVLGKETLKFWITDGNATISCVGFGMARYKEMITPQQPIDIAYHISIDDWRKAPVVQLKLKDIRVS